MPLIVYIVIAIFYWCQYLVRRNIYIRLMDIKMKRLCNYINTYQYFASWHKHHSIVFVSISGKTFLCKAKFYDIKYIILLNVKLYYEFAYINYYGF